MQSLNQVIIIGGVTADASLKFTNSGMAVSEFSIGMTKNVKEGDAYIDKSFFVNNLALLGKRAENLNQYLLKGVQIAIEGHLDTDNWTDNENKKKSKLKVVIDNIYLLSSKGRNDGPTVTSNNAEPVRPTQSGFAELNEDIPY